MLHISEHDIDGYLGRTLDPARLLAVDEHLSTCDECLSKLEEPAMPHAITVDSILDIDPALGQHLTYDMIEAYLDGRADDIDREIVDAHSGNCRDCSQDLNELLKLKELEIVPSVQATTIDAGWWQSVNIRRWMAIAAPVAAATLIGVVVWSMLDRRAADRAAVYDANAISAPTPSTSTTDPGGNPEDDQTAAATANTDPLPPLITLLDGGSKIAIDAHGRLTGLQDTAMEVSIKAALKNQSIDVSPIAKQLRPKGQVLMGDSSPGVPFALNGPVGKVIETDRPQFRWRPLKDAESYAVSVFDSGFNKVAESPPLKQTAWIPATKLKRGAIYQWQVTATKNGEEVKSPVMPAPEAKFKVIDATSANEIAAAKRNGGTHLVLGILYAKAGLLDEAEREFHALAEQNPGSPIPQRLLQRVRSAR